MKGYKVTAKLEAFWDGKESEETAYLAITDSENLEYRIHNTWVNYAHVIDFSVEEVEIVISRNLTKELAIQILSSVD